ncbi:MAG: heat-inducible transcription repressor HrcA [Candidatus Omnitrophica bacterium]|nr:heat-inducible transcription repressor HrcA [Candidatus Omnitrophota bacterium]
MRKVNLEYRKKIILKAIIESYVQTADPVGSKILYARYNMGLIPATIRQTMSELERSGYIYQPHTSAGRVPTDKGYRYYVDFLLENKGEEDGRDRERLEKKFYNNLKQNKDIDELIDSSLKLLTIIVNQVGIAICPRLKKSQFKYLQLIPGTSQRIQVILLTDSGAIRNFVISNPDFENDRAVYRLVNFLNQELRGEDIDRLDTHLMRKLEMKRDTLIERALELLKILELNSLPEENRLHLYGTRYILEQPEFQDTDLLRKVLCVLEDEKALMEILNDDLESEGVNIHIGQENKYPGVRECSLITCRYKLRGRPVGIIGALGTTRMEYAKVASSVFSIARMLGEAISERAE